jgi:hypothetical protein
VADVLPHPLSLLQLFSPGRLRHASWSTAHPAPGELRVLGQVSGQTLSIFISFNARPPSNSFEMRGTSGTIFINLFHGYSFFQAGGVSRIRKVTHPFERSLKECTVAATNLGLRFVRKEKAYPGLQLLVRSFYGAIRNNTPPPISANDAIEVAEVRDELMRSVAPVLERVAARS